jgi:hypothetical protein
VGLPAVCVSSFFLRGVSRVAGACSGVCAAGLLAVCVPRSFPLGSGWRVSIVLESEEGSLRSREGCILSQTCPVTDVCSAGVCCGLARSGRVIGLPFFSHVLLLNSVKRFWVAQLFFLLNPTGGACMK